MQKLFRGWEKEHYEKRHRNLLTKERIHMENLKLLQEKIESARTELGEALLQRDEFESYYRKSTELDRLIEEYLETKQQMVR